MRIAPPARQGEAERVGEQRPERVGSRALLSIRPPRSGSQLISRAVPAGSASATRTSSAASRASRNATASPRRHSARGAPDDEGDPAGRSDISARRPAPAAAPPEAPASPRIDRRHDQAPPKVRPSRRGVATLAGDTGLRPVRRAARPFLRYPPPAARTSVGGAAAEQLRGRAPADLSRGRRPRARHHSPPHRISSIASRPSPSTTGRPAATMRRAPSARLSRRAPPD